MNSGGPLPCPDCGQQLTGPHNACPACGLPLVGPAATELWRLDVALADLRAREGHLLARREVLLRTLRSERARTPVMASASAHPAWNPGVPQGPPPGAPAGPGRPADMSGRAVQNLLLGLGGLLLVVAAVVFTVVSWGYLGIGGRAAVLLGFTALTLATPLVLLRRGLNATAETVSLLGFVLLLLDGYAAWQVGLAGLDRIDPLIYTGVLIAVVSTLFCLYGLLVHVVAEEQIRALKLAVPVAIGFGQLALPVLTIEHSPLWITTALVATTAIDLLLWNVLKRRTAAVCFWITWSLGTVQGVLLTIQENDLRGAFAISGVLTAAAVIALLQATRGKWTVPLGAGAAIALAAALAYPLRLSVPADWWLVPTPLAAFLVGGIAVLARFRLGAPGRRLGKAVAIGAGSFGLLTATPVLIPVGIALAGPLERSGVWGDRRTVWDGPRALGTRDELGLNLVTITPPILVVVAAVAVALAACAALVRRRTAPIVSAVAVTAVLLAVLPVALNLPFWVLIAVQLLVVAGLAAGAVFVGSLAPAEDDARVQGTESTAGAVFGGPLAPAGDDIGVQGTEPTAGAVFGGSSPASPDHAHVRAAESAAGPEAGMAPAAGQDGALVQARAGFDGRLMEGALSVLGLAMVAEVAAWALISETATLISAAVLAVIAAGVAWRASLPAVRAWAAGVATALAGGEAVAVWLAADLDARYLTFVLLAVAALAAVAAWLLPRDVEGVEVAACGLAGIGLALAVDRRMLSIALALAGVIAVGSALRADRRQAGYVGTALLLLASWTRLSAEGVEVVEAYTVPVSVVLLAFGWWRARTASSWLAYGSGLSFSLLPSLYVLYAEPEHWIRPLALGVVSLAVLLAGARWRLQAPALLGGFTLAMVAVHELAPWVSELVLSVPRWVPVAVGGLLLLLVGATYEARLRDVRRFGSMIKGLR
ncbi:hypothetical protein Aph01nite_70500 [Acrocarpospora phusangensis]|uniref:DUF2157 domain-containing protein n=1 Tax=Acrocarpospora phusangensis TaxID=1070424 RepID=A0A919QJU2_9ACTN|nr:hypothetical protein [Acrocarpospora phusangensis]GIH28740.1 hypothetical protein Aph01nite_70500 [Acrocarpospora phusangensis]